MKTIGLIGGMSWESTQTYYQIINEIVKKQLGGLHSAKILLYSVDFAEIEQYQANAEWAKSAEILGEIAKNLERAGADFIVICTNTMHKVVPQIEAQLQIPVLHIAKATAAVLQRQQMQNVLLLGTKYTMTEDFYKEKLISAGINVVIPDAADIETINRIIYEELCQGVVSAASKQVYLQMIKRYAAEGVQGVILGCTEIGLLIKQADVSIPVFDTAQIHAQQAALHAIRQMD